MSRKPTITHVRAEPVTVRDADRLAHLGAHRGLIVRRALLAGAIRGLFPLPVLDDKLAGRVRAGLLAKLAALRQVDLPPASATVLAEAQEDGVGTGIGFATVAALVAKFAGRKFLAVLAAGRGADDMAHTFYRATLFDHYCAKLHVGGPITPSKARKVGALIEDSLRGQAGGPVLSAFRDGSRILGRSLLEAPRWLSQRLAGLVARFVHSGGNPEVQDAVPEPAAGDDAWLGRAAQAVEEALAGDVSTHLEKLVRSFEELWENARAD